MTFKIEIRGLDHLNGKLSRIQNQIGPTLFKATDRAVKYVHSTVPPYPPPHPESGYVRTGTLGRKIHTEVRPIGKESIGLIGTDVIYAPWVISDEAVGDRGPQAWMHEGRWYTLQEVVRKARKAVVQIYEQAVAELVRRS